MTVAELITLLRSCERQDAFVGINGQEYYPTGIEVDWYASEAHPVWLCSITVEIGSGDDFYAACDASHRRETQR